MSASPSRLSALLFLASLHAGVVYSQTATTAAAHAAPSFAAEPFVIQSLSVVDKMNADGTGYQEQTAVVRIQADAALRELGVLHAAFASQSQHVDIHYARVRRPDGTVLETSPTEAIEQAAPVTREAPFYSDLKEKQLPIKNLHVGDALEWQVRIVRTVAEARNQFWGQAAFVTQGVILAETHELRVPAAMHVTVWTNPKEAAPVQTAEGVERVYRWTHANLTPTVGKEAEAAKKATETHVLTVQEQDDLDHGKLASLAWTTYPDWAAVGAWYRALEATRMQPDEAVQAKVAELTTGKTTDEQKAHAIYDYVATQIRYIGVAFGIGRFQPHASGDVLANQYGDCKDKHTLLAAMLAAAGIRSDAVLIGAGIRFNADVPSPEAFNHLITRVYLPGSTVWLDATAEVAPWGALQPSIRDKDALVVSMDGPAVIARTPARLPYPASTTLAVTGSLDKDLTSDSHFTLTFRSDDEIDLRSALRQAAPAQYGMLVQQLMSGLGFGGTTSDAEISRVDDTATPLTIQFHYHRVKDDDWGANRITALFAPTFLEVVDPKKPPTSSINLGTPRTETSRFELKLPPGFGVELPEAVHAARPFATCDVTYRVANGTLYAERKLVILTDKVPASEWKSYQAWYDVADVGSVPYIQLTHNGSASADRSSSAIVKPAALPSNPEAARLIEQANTAIGNKEMDRARDLLDQAKALNPQQRNLWGTYGYRAYDLGMTNEAIESYRKELLFHPDQTWVYAPLAQELDRSGNTKEAAATLRDGVVADPKNLRIASAQVAFLVFHEQIKDAIAAGNDSLKLLPPDDPKNASLVLAVGHALVSDHDSTGLAALMLPLLATTTDPLIKNDAAYMLSEVNVHLPEAETAERSALEDLAAETNTWTLDETPAVLRSKSSLLFAAWDTMGWILFEEGHAHEAEPYLEAAWKNAQHTVVGEHLGKAKLAGNNPSAALATFQLALATTPHALPGSSSPAVEHLNQEIGEAKHAGGKSSSRDSHAELQQMRTIRLGSSRGHSGTVEYRLLLAADHVEAFRSVEGHALPQAEALLPTASFPGFIPPGSKAKIVRTAMINCDSEFCDAVLEP